MQPLIVCLMLTGIHGLFVMAEYSIVKTSPGDRGNHISTRCSHGLSQIHEHLEDYLLVSQIGKTGALMGVGIMLGHLLSNPDLVQAMSGTDWFIFAPGQFVLACITIGLTQLVLGQEVPKHWGVQHSDQCAEALSSFMRLSYVLVWPMLWIIKNLSAAFDQR